MGQSLVKNCVHIVFSTKHRQKLIRESIELELYSYLGGILKRMDSSPIKIGGYTDHVHILCILSKKHVLMKVVEEVKSHSSKWVKTKGELYRHFIGKWLWMFFRQSLRNRCGGELYSYSKKASYGTFIPG